MHLTRGRDPYFAQISLAGAGFAQIRPPGATEKEPGFVSVVAMAETAWVLERIYGLIAEEIT